VLCVLSVADWDHPEKTTFRLARRGGYGARSARSHPCYSQRTFSGITELDLYALLCVNSVHVYYA